MLIMDGKKKMGEVGVLQIPTSADHADSDASYEEAVIAARREKSNEVQKVPVKSGEAVM